MRSFAQVSRSSAAALLAVVFAATTGTTAPNKASPLRRAEGFSHATHVSARWIALKDGAFAHPETRRDCRGCHSFEERDGREVSVDPQATCAACHFPAANGAASLTLPTPNFAWTEHASRNLRAPDARRGAFVHGDHANLDCRECHAGATVKRDGEGFVADVMPVPQGLTWCVKCHGPTESARDPRAFEGAVFDRFVDKLNTSPRMAHVDVFRHDEHYRIGTKDSAGGCDGCHRLGSSTEADLAKNEYAVDTCAPCHKPQDVSAPITFDHRVDRVKSRAALCFDHKAHLSAAALSNPTLKSEGCLACHVYEGEKATYDLKPGFGTYAACAECHQRATPDAKTPPPLDPTHGKWDDPKGWAKCSSCHALDATAAPGEPHRSMKDNRPLASKARPRAGLFRVATQKHPHVAGGDVSAACSTCHVATLRELPSRIVEAPFSHATHVPAVSKAGVDSCASCHRGPVYGTTTSDQIGRTYDPASCVECHLGAAPIEGPPPAVAASSKPPFDFNHALHLGKNHPDRTGGAAAMRCDDCHGAPDASGAIGVKAGAASCIDCHRHDDARKDITGGKGSAEVLACSKCHAAYMPARGEEVFTARATIVGQKAGVQLHEAKTGESCESCHKVIDVPRRELRADKTHVFAATRKSPHEGANPRYPLDASGKAISCAKCHWRDWPRLPSGTLSDDLRDAKGALKEDAVRVRDGARVEGFPGVGAPR